MGDEGKAVGCALRRRLCLSIYAVIVLNRVQALRRLIIRADVLFTPGGQYEPRVSHNEQCALSVQIIEGLIALNKKRYLEKIANATTDDDGINALEELLKTDPSLAELFGGTVQSKVAAKTIAAAVAGFNVDGDPIA